MKFGKGLGKNVKECEKWLASYFEYQKNLDQSYKDKEVSYDEEY